MISNPDADRIYNLYADLEASFLDLSCLIGTDQSANRANIDGPLHLVSQHISFLNEKLYIFLKSIDQPAADQDSKRAQAEGESLTAPVAVANGNHNED